MGKNNFIEINEDEIVFNNELQATIAYSNSNSDILKIEFKPFEILCSKGQSRQFRSLLYPSKMKQFRFVLPAFLNADWVSCAPSTLQKHEII